MADRSCICRITELNLHNQDSLFSGGGRCLFSFRTKVQKESETAESRVESGNKLSTAVTLHNTGLPGATFPAVPPDHKNDLQTQVVFFKCPPDCLLSSLFSAGLSTPIRKSKNKKGHPKGCPFLLVNDGTWNTNTLQHHCRCATSFYATFGGMGISHGLSMCPPDTCLPSLRSGRPFDSRTA